MGRWMWSVLDHDEVYVDESDVWDEEPCVCGECFICEYEEDEV